MRTRRSPKNQEILWRALGGPVQKTPVVDKVALAERALALPFLSARTRRMFERDLPAKDVACPVCESWTGTPGALLGHLEELHGGSDWKEQHPEAAGHVRAIFAPISPKPRRR